MDTRTRVRVIGVMMVIAFGSAARAEGFYFGLNAGGSEYDVASSDLAQPLYAAVPASGVVPYNPFSTPPIAAFSTPGIPTLSPTWSAFGIACSQLVSCTRPVLHPLQPASESLDRSGTAMKFDVGYRFNSYFAAELAYADLGTATHEVTYNMPGPGSLIFPLRQVSDVEVDGIGVSLLGSYPFARQWSAFLRGGYFFGDAQTTYRVNNSPLSSPTFSADNAFAATGIDYSFAQHWGVRLEYQRFFDTGGQALRNEADVDTWSLGLQYRL